MLQTLNVLKQRIMKKMRDYFEKWNCNIFIFLRKVFIKQQKNSEDGRIHSPADLHEFFSVFASLSLSDQHRQCLEHKSFMNMKEKAFLMLEKFRL